MSSAPSDPRFAVWPANAAGAPVPAPAAPPSASAPLPPASAFNSPDPGPRIVELVQRGRIALDVATADLDVAEGRLGVFHPTTLHFRRVAEEARRAWERLRATYGPRALARALEADPIALLTLDDGRDDGRAPWLLMVIGGRVHAARKLDPAEDAPVIWRLRRFPDLDDDPLHVCRLADGSLQCDCAQWIYELADPRGGIEGEGEGEGPGGRPGTATAPPAPCKHQAALRSLGWL